MINNLNSLIIDNSKNNISVDEKEEKPIPKKRKVESFRWNSLRKRWKRK